MSSNISTSWHLLRHWQLTPLLRLSLLWHALAAVITLLRLQWWPWTLTAVIADHLLLVALGLWPRSRALGSNWTRLPARSAARGEVAITIDDGPDPEITPQVLAILAAHGAHATFFCIGRRVEQFPQLARECLSQGHTIENHSDRHALYFSLLGLRALQTEIARAQQRIEYVAGVAPRFFRAPAGLRSPLLDPVLQRLGLQLASWTRRGFDTINADAPAVLARLIRQLCAGDILLLHDGHAARTSAGTAVVLEVLPPLLAAIAQRGLRTVTLREALA
ncbi:MAG TPA: polysaccharide deacetylase family protein [Steroidobacteraceae bacterium]|jgi:peptidoglycan/xylan/chitin deacetylase (PgdA/CDA1 family)